MLIFEKSKQGCIFSWLRSCHEYYSDKPKIYVNKENYKKNVKIAWS